MRFTVVSPRFDLLDSRTVAIATQDGHLYGLPSSSSLMMSTLEAMGGPGMLHHVTQAVPHAFLDGALHVGVPIYHGGTMLRARATATGALQTAEAASFASKGALARFGLALPAKDICVFDAQLMRAGSHADAAGNRNMMLYVAVQYFRKDRQGGNRWAALDLRDATRLPILKVSLLSSLERGCKQAGLPFTPPTWLIRDVDNTMRAAHDDGAGVVALAAASVSGSNGCSTDYTLLRAGVSAVFRNASGASAAAVMSEVEVLYSPQQSVRAMVEQAALHVRNAADLESALQGALAAKLSRLSATSGARRLGASLTFLRQG